MPPADQVGGLLLQIDLNGSLRVYGSNCAEHDRQFEDPPHKNRNLCETKKFQTSQPCSAEHRPSACSSRQLAANRVTNVRVLIPQCILPAARCGRLAPHGG